MTTAESGPLQLPLPALLSAALVAFTIEFDNAAELQMQHRTTRPGSTLGGVWLVSMAMWLNCMRYAGTEPITAGELARLARTNTNLDGMRRWGYITLTADPADTRASPPRHALLVRATSRGQRAQEVWRPLTAVIGERWRDRFGAAAVSQLIAAAQQIARQLPGGLPDCLPILGPGLYCAASRPGAGGRALAASSPPPPAAAGRNAAKQDAAERDVAGLALPWLLARVLLAIALEFEDESPLSLAISANLLRILDQRGTRLRDLPMLSGVSKESLAMASGVTGKRGLTVIEADVSGGPWKTIRLTAKGDRARADYADRVAAIETRWQVRFGGQAVRALRGALEPLVVDAGPGSPLRAGLTPAPGNWRAETRQPEVLPHFPMLLHRGGYPDGS